MGPNAEGREKQIPLANFIFVVLHLKIHLTVHLNTWKALTSLLSKRKVYSKFSYSDVLTRVKKGKMVCCERLDVLIQQTKILK